MGFSSFQLTNLVGTRLLPFTNPRVVCPPGVVSPNGRPNVIVATPMRSGTHILIDMILNNIPAYRNRPLYVDLDQCRKQGNPQHDLLGQITADMGYLVKTHLPIGVEDENTIDLRIHDLIAAGVVITVRRDRDEVSTSLARWHKLPPGADVTGYEIRYDAFWRFWEARAQTRIGFKDLFKQDRMSALLDLLCERTGTYRTNRFSGPISGTNKARIYANKGLTRILGRHAPRVDTTIHTLKG